MENKYYWLFCEHCQKLQLPYIPDKNNKIKSISDYCLHCKKKPTEKYLLEMNGSISSDTFKKIWWPFNEIDNLSANMSMYPFFPELGYNNHIKEMECNRPSYQTNNTSNKHNPGVAQ